MTTTVMVAEDVADLIEVVFAANGCHPSRLEPAALIAPETGALFLDSVSLAELARERLATLDPDLLISGARLWRTRCQSGGDARTRARRAWTARPWA